MNKVKGVLYWITGLSGAGKTTIGNYLYYILRQRQDNVILLDGDILKTIVADSCTYTEEDRHNRAKKYAKLCKTLTDQGMVVICCTIAMFEDVREWNRKNNRGYVEVFLDVPMNVLKERDQKGLYSSQANGQIKNLSGVDMDVEFPRNPDITILNDGSVSVKECVNRILEYKVNYAASFDRDTAYWNLFYASNPEIEHPSLFAEYVYDYLEEGKTLLELGCGNGRDSIYFSEKVDVTAIDASDKAIADLNEVYGEKAGLRFLCDDFVCTSALFQRQYDYCYSRFTIHAINEEQEINVISNVRHALKNNGLFFIEVRSVNDELYGKGKPVGKNAYIYNGHYRRFIVLDELKDHLVKSGFKIIYAKEARDFAPFGDSNPPIIRIVAKAENIKE